MGTLVATEFVTLDGVMEAPGGEPGHPHSGWVAPFMDDELGEVKFGEVAESGSHLLGRVTYESFAGTWPQRQGPFAEKLNAMPKFVVTSTLEQLEWNNSVAIAGDVAAEVEALKRQEEEQILIAGSRTLVQALLLEGLIDELRMMVFPVAVGSGDRLFPDSPDKLSLELVGQRTFSNGVQYNSLRPASS